ncbi:MAG: class I SAM-dependent methyltransferase family protein [Candidatus Bathyarchaeota archaeon]|nr:class I SAM-dependent methyltransferase family protein [Candidatus Bathyarchaeota archaeon]
MPRPSLCIKVPKNQGEKTLTLAAKLGLADKTLVIQREEGSLCIPLLREPGGIELATLKSQISDFSLFTAAFSEKQQPPESLNQALQDKLPTALLASVPQAYDVIGDIVVIDLPAKLKPYQELVGEAVLQIQKSAKTVLAKAGDISGVYRVRDYTYIAGEHKTQTVHREFGCSFHVDLARAYFSPRLSHEHMRVAGLVAAGEVVADLFAGVGPFSVLIGKKCPFAKVYAVDLNPDAVELLELNVRVNRVVSNVFPMLADARIAAGGKLRGRADRVIMNLPETALDFVDAACSAVKPDGGVVHFYGFVRQPDSVENFKLRFSDAVAQNGRCVEEFLLVRSIRETAPFESQVALDAKIR